MLCNVLLFISCEDFVEVDLPETQLTGPVVFQNEATATAALSDIYARMRENGVISGNVDGLSLLLGLYTDDLEYYGSGASPMNGFYNHSLIPSNENVSSLWRYSYSQIYAVNALLEGVAGATEISPEAQNQLRGEALFLRAILHFYAAILYGDIPYITTTDYEVNAQVSRMPLQTLYEKIITDLQEAKALLTQEYAVPERVRVNRAAAQALLARAYLYQEQWSLAELEATEVINHTGAYSLATDLDAAFLNNNPSTIWQLHPGIAGSNTWEGRLFIFTDGPPPIAAASEHLVAAFETNDLRKEHWLKEVTTGTTSWYHPYKYKLNVNTGGSQEYSIILRLEEQYLIRAEARARLGNISGAQADLNTIRNRAGLNDTPAATQQEVLETILQERRLEFFSELGHRWFDLKRTGEAAAVLGPIKPGWQNRSLLLPLPETELILNPNLEPQNPGY